jgi:hypothetical protein
VAAVAVKNKETIGSTRTRRCMSVEVLYPLNAELISRPAIVTYGDYLGIRYIAILAGLVELPGQDYERRDRPPRRVDTLNCRDPVAIARLYDDCLTNSV